MTPAQEQQIDTAYRRLLVVIDQLRTLGVPEAAIREAIRRLRDE